MRPPERGRNVGGGNIFRRQSSDRLGDLDRKTHRFRWSVRHLEREWLALGNVALLLILFCSFFPDNVTAVHKDGTVVFPEDDHSPDATPVNVNKSRGQYSTEAATALTLSIDPAGRLDQNPMT